MPLKAKDLRIGNLIYICGNTIETYQTYYPRVVTIDIIREISEENEERHDAMLSAFNPIPLTEEWLIKLGFEDKENNKWFSKTVIEVGYIDNDDNLQMEYKTPISKWILMDIKFVHQLQNLYYALTGTELNITP